MRCELHSNLVSLHSETTQSTYQFANQQLKDCFRNKKTPLFSGVFLLDISFIYSKITLIAELE